MMRSQYFLRGNLVAKSPVALLLACVSYSHEKSHPAKSGLKIPGADNGIRTRDPHLGKVMLYQLSHVRVNREYYTQTFFLAQEVILMARKI